MIEKEKWGKGEEKGRREGEDKGESREKRRSEFPRRPEGKKEITATELFHFSFLILV